MTENRIPPDSAQYLSGPMPKYANGKFTVNGTEIDANSLDPIDPEPADPPLIPGDDFELDADEAGDIE